MHHDYENNLLKHYRSYNQELQKCWCYKHRIRTPVGSRPVTTPRHNSDHTATGSHGIGDNPNGDDPGDENHGGGQGNENPGGPNDDPPDNGPSDQSDNPDDSNDDVQHNLADAIAALAWNVQHQGDGSRSKVWEPDPFDGTNPTKLRTFLVQLQLSFNDRPRAFAKEHRKVNFAISYLKGIALAHFENSLIEPDLYNPPAWGDDYNEFVSELKT